MKFRKLIPSLAVAAFATVALAHHLPVGLSSPFGTEILHKIIYVQGGGPSAASAGVPPYVIGTEEEATAITPFSSFVVTDGEGASETVTFDPSQFADITAAEPQEIVDAVNAQLTIARAELANDSVALHGLAGGTGAEMHLADGAIPALGTLDLAAGVVSGANDIDLTLSVPAADDPDAILGNLPYVIIASATPGVTHVAGFEVPVLLDATTGLVMRATQVGALPGFVGSLDGNADATATFKTKYLKKMFPAGLPSSLYFTYVVFNSSATKIAYVSNLFEVEIQ